VPRLNYVRVGSGKPLALIHPLGGGIVVWRPVLERLAREREVVAMDMPGFGASPAASDGFVPTAANLAAEVNGLLSELGIERPHVAGISLGGWVALEMAKSGHAASVCAISPAGMWRRPLEPGGDRQAIARRLRPALPALLASRRIRRWLLSTTVANPDAVPREEAAELVLGFVDSAGYAGSNAEMRAGAFEHADRIGIPVTIAWGSRDRTVGRPSRTRRPPNTRYVERPGWGHVPTWDDPDGVAELILAASSGDGR
jgi:pimeloyl-ACP methyl ester carboxylesterase